MEVLHELIDSCTSKGVPQSEMHVVNNLHRYKKRTRKEMRLTSHTREYDMDQVILDLGSDASFQERLGNQWVSQSCNGLLFS